MFFLFLWSVITMTAPVELVTDLQSHPLGAMAEGQLWVKATITCQVNLDKGEVLQELRMENEARKIYLRWKNQPGVYNTLGSLRDDRFSRSSHRTGSNSRAISLDIDRPQCADEKVYVCRAIYRNARGSRLYKRLDVHLRTDVVPRFLGKPAILPASVQQTGGIPDGTKVRVVRYAILGRPGQGVAVWKIYRGRDNRLGETLDPYDTRVQTVVVDGPAQGPVDRGPFEESINSSGSDCYDLFQTTLTTEVARVDQEVVIAIFLVNWKYQMRPPEECVHEPFCWRTQRFTIHYPVSKKSLELRVFPPLYIMAEDSLILICQASGLPKPRYQWVKVKDMSGRKLVTPLANVSRVDFKAVTPEGHGGVYSCVASNVVGGKSYNVSKSINIFIDSQHNLRAITSASILPCAIIIVVVYFVRKRKPTWEEIKAEVNISQSDDLLEPASQETTADVVVTAE